MDMRQVFAIATAQSRHERERPLDPERILTSCSAVLYDWDLATDRLTWGPNLRAVFGLDRRHKLPTGRSYNALVVPGSGDSRDDAILASRQSDSGAGVAYRCRYVLGCGGRKFVVEDSGAWFAGGDGRPAWAEGLVRAYPVGRRASDPERGPRPEPARDRVLRALTTLLHDPARPRNQITVMVGIVERSGAAGDGELERAPDEPDMARVEAYLQRRLRRRDLLVHLSPSRFCLVLTSCGVDQALAAARGLSELAANSGPAPLVVRIGAVTAGERSGDAEALLERSEEAADHARTQQLTVWRLPPRLRRRAVPRPKSLSSLDLIAALNSRRIRLVREPLMELANQEMGFDLIRAEVAHDDGSFAGSYALPPLAERLRLTPLLDHRVLELSLQVLRAEPLTELLMSVSAATLVGPGWLATLAAYAGAHPGVIDRLAVAIDERAFAPPGGAFPVGRATVLTTLSAMKALGIRVAITGYGGGRLTLEEVADLSIDALVVNRTLVNDGAVNASHGRFALRSLVAGARHLALPVFGHCGQRVQMPQLPANGHANA